MPESKAKAFAAEAVAAGWDCWVRAAKSNIKDEVVVARKGDHRLMLLIWKKGRYVYGPSVVWYGAQSWTIKNVDEARRHLVEGTTDDATVDE